MWKVKKMNKIGPHSLSIIYHRLQPLLLAERHPNPNVERCIGIVPGRDRLFSSPSFIVLAL